MGHPLPMKEDVRQRESELLNLTSRRRLLDRLRQAYPPRNQVLGLSGRSIFERCVCVIRLCFIAQSLLAVTKPGVTWSTSKAAIREFRYDGTCVTRMDWGSCLKP